MSYHYLPTKVNGLQYSLTCEVDDSTKATAHIGTTAGEATANGYIPNLTNIKDVKIYLRPTENLQEGDTVKLVVTASTTVPYKKQISATFNIKVTGQSITYSIEDEATSIYATLKLVNTKNTTNQITLSYDPEEVVIDVTHEYYENRISQTTTNIDGVEYVNSVTFNMEPADVKNIWFYKKDINANYTYPGGTATDMVVTITESN